LGDREAEESAGAAVRATPTAKLGRLWAVRQGPAIATNDQQRSQTPSSPARHAMTPHLAGPGIQYERI